MSSSGVDDDPIPSPTASFNEYQTRLQQAVVSSATLSSHLPPKTDLTFQRTLSRKFAKELDVCSAQILDLANQLLQLASGGEPGPSTAGTKGKGKVKPSALRLKDEEDLLDHYHASVVDVVDGLLENVDQCIDEFTGKRKTLAVPLKPPAAESSRYAPKLEKSLIHAAHLPKPQLTFKKAVDNSQTTWRPSLKTKPHAQLSLSDSLQGLLHETPDLSLLPELVHPYRYEITHISYPSKMMAHASPQPPQSFDMTPFTWVDSPSQLPDLLSKLKQAQEIAVDLEYHNYRSFTGFVCLMQISTRNEDWVVDTLALRDELEQFNEVFADPKITKVFHGAESDILWLQQDFNLYVVNLFDTYHASVALDFPKRGLAHLLSLYCDFTADKRYQLADWRIRPIPEEMLHYARADTHFLLFIYDNLRNALLERGSAELLRAVLSHSEQTALKVCQPEIYDAAGGFGSNGWLSLTKKWNKSFFGSQEAILLAVHAWRDRVAREEDESPRYVLPNQSIFLLTEKPPATSAMLLTLVRPTTPIVRARATELLGVIQEAQAKAQQRRGTDSQPKKAQSITVPQLDPVDFTGFHPNDSTKPDLWNYTTAPIVASSSTLFGSALQPKPPSSFVALTSSLFSAASSSSSTSTPTFDRYQDVVKKIHDQITPPAPTAPDLKVAFKSEGGHPATTLASSSEAVEPAIPTEPEGIPFVPVAQRQTVSMNVGEEEEAMDDIVVVGAARQKKRKRDKQKKRALSPADSGEAQPSQKGSIQVDDFDYSSVPNILDDHAEPGGKDGKRLPGKKRRVSDAARNKAKQDMMHGDFSRAPRPTHEPKSGNMTHTFK